MGKVAGQVSVKMTEATVRAVADWISHAYLPARKADGTDSLLAAEYSREQFRLLADLSVQLRKILRRKALKKGMFVRPVTRKSVLALLTAARYRRGHGLFGSASEEHWFSGDLRQGLEWMVEALRPPHRASLTVSEIRGRAEGHVQVDDRHKREMAARLREIEETVRLYRLHVPLLGRTSQK